MSTMELKEAILVAIKEYFCETIYDVIICTAHKLDTKTNEDFEDECREVLKDLMFNDIVEYRTVNITTKSGDNVADRFVIV